jgi:hypothetical protein
LLSHADATRSAVSVTERKNILSFVKPSGLGQRVNLVADGLCEYIPSRFSPKPTMLWRKSETKFGLARAK